MTIKAVLIDKRTPQSVVDAFLAELSTGELIGFDIETEDEARHQGLNIYNNAKRHVFDHRRTNITGFSTHVEGSDTAYYVNTMQADVENRMPLAFALQVIAAINPDAITVAHNAPFEITMLRQCWGGVELPNLVCTMQMAVSHHGPDEYDLTTFYNTPLPASFHKFAKPIIDSFSQVTQGDKLNGNQQELLGKFVGKTSKADHSYNGYVKTIATGYSLKNLTFSHFGVKQKTYQEVLKENNATHMGELTGEQVLAYGADDAYWAVRHYRWMFDEMLRENPKALRAFFTQENPMIHFYADAWQEGIRLDLEQVFERRDIERHEMAEALRVFKKQIREQLPFPALRNEKLWEREGWYVKGWEKKRKDIEKWANSADSADDFEQCFQVSNPIGNAWYEEKNGKAPPKGKLNLGYWQTMRSIMYDLLEFPIQYQDGGVASDSDARGKIREKLTKGEPLELLMKNLQAMAEIEQRMKLYLTPYTQLMDPETSHVYPSLSSQLATRRLATSFPNPMQLAKRGSSTYIRSFYLPDDDDSVVISADWSAVELVIIGDQSLDPGFIKVYGQLPYGDMHTGSAVDGLSVKTMPGLTEEEFKEFKFGNNPNNRLLVDFAGTVQTPKDYYTWARGTAIGKGINFGYWYSGAVSTVAENLGLTDAQHWELVDKYRARFPIAEQWRIDTQNLAAVQGFIELPDGHRRNRFEVTQEWRQAMERKFADLSVSHGMLEYGRLAAKRLQGRGRNQVVNSMVQGTNATLSKRSLLNLKKAVNEAGMVGGVDVRLMMPIHDELVFSVKRRVVMAFLPILRSVMANHPDIVKHLPLNCTVAMGRTFRPFDKTNPKFSQIELDEAQLIEGLVDEDLKGSKLSDEKVAEILDWMFT